MNACRPHFASITFHRIHRVFADQSGSRRLEHFEVLSADDQAEAWAHLREQLECRRLAEGNVEWPELEVAPERPVRLQANPAVPSGFEDDPLREIPPPVYFEVLTGEHVPPSGVVRCPNPDHEDSDPSCKVYPEPDRGFFCFGCQQGGGAIDLASMLAGTGTRGDDYLDLRRWVLERLTGSAAA